MDPEAHVFIRSVSGAVREWLFTLILFFWCIFFGDVMENVMVTEMKYFFRKFKRLLFSSKLLSRYFPFIPCFSFLVSILSLVKVTMAFDTEADAWLAVRSQVDQVATRVPEHQTNSRRWVHTGKFTTSLWDSLP